MAALPVAIVAIGVTGIGLAYFVPDKLRNIALKIGGATSIVAQVLPATLPEPSKIEQAYWLPQNWTWQKRYWFHHTSQGTTTIPVPYEWFLALERPELSLSHHSLRDDDYLRRLGFIPSPSSKGFAGDAPRYGYHGEEPKADPAQLDWQPGLPDNPDGLPVGFARLRNAVDPTTGEQDTADQLGLTCAACHTGHLEYKNVSIRFDGGPSMVNLGEVERAIGLSIGYTLKIPGRFSRFASRLEEIQGHPVDRSKLRDDLQHTLDGIFAQKELETQFLADQKADHLDEGFGRLDALNRIGNQVFFTNFLDKKSGALPDPALAGNLARHDAPVSFPPIWDTPYFLWAQYDASVFNELVRNAGEALGVSARINMTTAAPGRPLFGSSVKMENLVRFEEALRGTDPFKASGGATKFNGLLAPKWTDAHAKFPGDAAWAIDAKLVKKGRDLYRAHCFECHRGPVDDAEFDQKYPNDSFWKAENPDRAAKNEKNWIAIGDRHYFNGVQVPLSVVGTDRQQSRVLIERRVHLPASLGLAPIDDLNKTGGCGLLHEEVSDVPFVLALMDVVGKSIEQWYIANGTSEELKRQMSGPRQNCQNPRVFVAARASSNGKDREVLAAAPHYVARPLDGVWATAPYLHNGSVPTLRDMLLPQDRRPRSFCVGSREFDPVNVGLATKAGKDDACAAGLTDFDVSRLGNSNRGHSFEGKETDIAKLPSGVIGPELTDDERRSLIEYLKTL
ncbi:di-heme-cytochrome C peroxidase [Bradyrhizobium sp. Ec3.3]|uniref:di-heme-cytochrome C peroxidase n=1 Tax=Bradyrhizobium sp. Ec3.3 TaxID=189753 RepID=UPI00040D08D0|nr:di-heme-cytochrome C peroxidase [Bradyrhizobium sp. Ec3.3]